MIFWKGSQSKKNLKKENEELREALVREEKNTFEEYFKKNTTISTEDGLGINFGGPELVKIFASSFWDMVQDSDNYVVCDLYSTEGKSVEVTIKKKGKLSPQDKLNKAEDLLARLLEENDTASDTAFEAYDYLNGEEELRKKYDEQE